MDLQTLIARRRGGASLQQLADRSGMSKQTWATHANPPEDAGRRMPEAETIMSIARGLGVEVESVLLAIGETMGVLDPARPRPALLDELPPAEVLARLSPEQVDTVVRLVILLASDDVQRAARAQRTGPDAARADAAAAQQIAAARRGHRRHTLVDTAAAGQVALQFTGA